MLLALSLIGCAPKVVQVPVDPRLTADCEFPTRKGNTNADIAEAYIQRGSALQKCTERMRIIRQNK